MSNESDEHGIPTELRDILGALLNGEMPELPEPKVTEGKVGRNHWITRVYPTDNVANEILVEIAEPAHPTIDSMLSTAADNAGIQIVSRHYCEDGPDEWDKTLHVWLSHSEAAEEVAALLAKAADRARISKIYASWLRFRTWLARKIKP